jgi:photosystem II stability/assembly factor-like uncharacterized protein
MKTWLPVTMILFGLSNVADFAFGQTWMQSDAPDNSWVSVASSADGTKLVAASTLIQSGTGQIYTSTNSGLNWTVQANAPATNWSRVASSADGNKLVAIENTTIYGETNSPFNASGIYTSTDSGVTWTLQTNAPNAYWNSVVSSPDGNRLAATAAFGTVYLSTDAGTNWKATDLPTNFVWGSIAASTDGSKLVVTGNYCPIYVSTNSGATWTQVVGLGTNRFSVAASVDGMKFAAATLFDGLYVSTNSGTDWLQITNAPRTPGGNWHAIVFSAENKMIVSAIGAPIYLSADCGETWITNSAPINHTWQAIAVSADGNKLVAAEWALGIWVSQTTPSPKLRLAKLGDADQRARAQFHQFER